MADVTRDSYQDSKNYEELIFQRRKDVLDAELNEAQRIARARAVRIGLAGGYLQGGAVDDGCLVVADGATANQLTVKAGTMMARGHIVQLSADETITGLTTPGVDRIDDVWLRLTQLEVNSSTDSNIRVLALGETALRYQLRHEFVVDEGAAAPPASTSNPPWLGGTWCLRIARVYRAAASATIAASRVVDMRMPSEAVRTAQDRNLTILAKGIGWTSGNVLSIAELEVYVPGETGRFSMTNVSVTCGSSKDAVGWLATAPGNSLRRNLNGQVIAYATTATHIADKIDTVTAIDALTSIDSVPGHILVLGVRIGDQFVWRNGHVLNYGDYVHHLGAPGSMRSRSESVYSPLLVGRDPSTGAARSIVDHNGYRTGQVSEWVEDWRTSGTTEPAGWAFQASTSGTRAYSDPISGFPYRHVLISTGTTAGSSPLLATNYITYIDADRTAVLEWDLRTGADVDTGSSMDLTTGWIFSNGGSNNHGVFFRFNPDVNANVLAEIAGSSTSQTSSGVAVAINTTYRLRIEICGDNAHAGSNFLARFFINGALVHSATFSSPVADAVRLAHQIDNNGGVTNYQVRVGPMRGNWNWRLTPDEL
jgi:hypothetical protein